MIPSASLSLQITQKFGKLGFDFEKPKLEIRQPAGQLEIVQKPAKMQIDQGLGKVQVDGEAARAAVGHRTSERMVSDVASAVRQMMLEVIGDIAAEGDYMAAFEKGNKVEDIPLQREGRGPSPVHEPGPASYTPVQVSYQPHETRVDWTLGGVEITPRTYQPEINYTPGSVKRFVETQNWIQVEPKGQYMNITF